jgi:hypothetical protein
MKGTIVTCMQELVTKKFGPEKWKECLNGAGLGHTLIMTTTDVPDAGVQKLIESISVATKLSMAQVIDAFGEYWSTQYAPEMYGVYFKKAHSARELLVNLDHIHTAMTTTMKGANPPHFDYEWESDKVLLMHYKSHRGLVALMPPLIRGIAKYYHEQVDVKTINNPLRVHFLSNAHA